MRTEYKIRLSLIANLHIKGDPRHCNAITASEMLRVGFLCIHKALLLLSCMFGLSYYFHIIKPVNAGFRRFLDLPGKVPKGFIEPREVFQLCKSLFLQSMDYTVSIRLSGDLGTLAEYFLIPTSKSFAQFCETTFKPRHLQADIAAEGARYQSVAFVFAAYIALKRQGDILVKDGQCDFEKFWGQTVSKVPQDHTDKNVESRFSIVNDDEPPGSVHSEFADFPC